MTRIMRAMAAVTAFSILFPGSGLGKKQTRACEFVARVNGEIISETDYEQALTDFRDNLNDLARAGSKTPAEVEVGFESGKAAVLDSMIEDLLLDQIVRNLRLAENLEVKKLIDSDSQPRPGAVQISARARESYDRALLREEVIQREVVEPLIRNVTDRQLIDYYNNHPEDFTLPATVTLSQVFIPFASRTDAANRAKGVLAELRAGRRFIEVLRENTPGTHPLYSKDGYTGTFKLRELRESVAHAIEKLNPGEFAEPIQQSNGYSVFRLDERTPPTLLSFDDPEVQKSARRLCAGSRLKPARALYIGKLRERARIEICSPR